MAICCTISELSSPDMALPKLPAATSVPSWITKAFTGALTPLDERLPSADQVCVSGSKRAMLLTLTSPHKLKWPPT
ncbi:MAG: hypothetical protein ABS96_18025 [Lysobacteraceae bacterium SCN 69-123]|nr:MAG: hypothetical protein ABS96_18025 [Xanthomonadaceae bacterium SCN 69-123]